MDSVDLEVLKTSVRWLEQKRRVLLVTVVKTWGSSPRPEGAMLALRDDGVVVGSVSGGCIEDDLIDRVRREGLQQIKPEAVKYGISAEEAHRFGLPCGGTLQLVLEPLTAASGLDDVRALLHAVEAGQLVARTLDMATGATLLEHANVTDGLQFDEQRLVTIHGPRYRMLVIGAGQLTHYVAQMALACDYSVTICDPREEYAEGWLVPGTELVRTMPDDTVIAMKPDRNTAIIALTHDPKLDDLALMEALRSDAFYVGAIGSQKNQAARKERLLEFGVSAEQMTRLHGPVGLKNGARTPPEIAVSIMAELTGAKYGYVIPTPVALAPATTDSGCAA